MEALVVGSTVALCGYYLVRAIRKERESRSVLDETREAGLTEPASLHPVIDLDSCIGAGSCVAACPENLILGVVDGKAVLVDPTRCIGHGACRAACGQGAIELVFGTETRGVDIPNVKPNFETNVPGLFIAGELGGMGLIRNAVEQGRQAMDSIRHTIGAGKNGKLDVVIVGAGPAGFSASLAAMEDGLRHVTVEQDTLGGTVAHYPRGKVVMTAPVKLPMYGKARFTETTKEKLLAFWEDVEQKTGVEIRYQERVENVTRDDEGFVVTTTRGTYESRSVLLAIGRRGTPRKLGVPGEELSKVTYRLIDPEQYSGQAVLVVGGGDSALEAATGIAAEPGTIVTLSYRSEAFSRAKPKNRRKVQEAEASGRLTILMKSCVREITPSHVRVEHDGTVTDLPNDAVIICAGGILPTSFLEEIGIEIETKFGTT
jgi:thioredoxin reductase/NAD-dependent dihydropyrimidine dehydrogenase PreA subunit